jgi:AcrR family transcriptional regulator
VARAQVAKGTFYLYFRDKRSVFSELVDLLFQRLSAAILKVDTQSDVDTQVKHNIRAIVAVLLEDPPLTRILISFATGMDPAFVAKIQSFYAGVKTMLAESLAEGQRLGIVAAGDPHLLATFTVGALKELLAEGVDGQTPLAREPIVDAVFSFLKAGYLRTQSDSDSNDDRPAAPTRPAVPRAGPAPAAAKPCAPRRR